MSYTLCSIIDAVYIRASKKAKGKKAVKDRKSAKGIRQKSLQKSVFTP